MCRLGNIAMHDYHESVNTGQTGTQTYGQTDAGQSDHYVPLCFAGDTTYGVILSRVTQKRALSVTVT